MKNIKIRVGGICVYDNKILLIHRINLGKEKSDQEYYAIPGGGVEDGEGITRALIREMKEETNLDIKVGKLFYEMQDKDPKGDNRKHYYYSCIYTTGEPKLREDSEEAREMKLGVNFYNPVWIDLKELQNIALFPKQIKQEIIDKFITE
jgi:ADP-ribose pyrophosphatase YjhB (NUDIX family)